MKCMALHCYGDHLVAEERPDPAPTGSQIVLRVLAAGVCHSDIHVRDGGYDIGHGDKISFAARGLGLPRILGHETVGEVIAAGPEATGITPGQRFVIYSWNGCGECATCARGAENLCLAPRFLGIHCDGGYSEQIVVPHPRYLFPLKELDPATAAPLPCSGSTAFGAIKKVEAEAKAGRIAVIGAGGLGLMAINLLAAIGAHPPIVVDPDPRKREAALAHGAAGAVDSEAPDRIEAIQSLAGGPLEGVIDFVGNEQSTALAFDLIGKGGKIVIVGLYGGAAPWALPMIPLKSAVIMGSYMGTLPEFEELMGLVHAGKVAAIPVETVPLAAADATLDRLQRGEIIGRAVIRPHAGASA